MFGAAGPGDEDSDTGQLPVCCLQYQTTNIIESYKLSLFLSPPKTFILERQEVIY